MKKDFHPHNYQRYCIDQIIEKPSIGLFLDMGLGKTVITLTALYEMKYLRWSMKKALVIAPKKVAEGTWSNEQATWNHLAPVRVVKVLGDLKKRVKALNEVADVYVINRDNVTWLVKYYGHNWPFDVVVLDESSSFKNQDTKRFKALKAVRPRIRKLIELTGTPAPKGLMDLWAQVYLLDGGARLGRTISVYRELFFTKNDWEFDYKEREGAREVIFERLSDICISMKAEDYLTLPDCITEDIPVVLDSKAQAAYKQLQDDALLRVDPDTYLSPGVLGVLRNTVVRIVGDRVQSPGGIPLELDRCKVNEFPAFIGQAGDRPLMVFYKTFEDMLSLAAVLSELKISFAVYKGDAEASMWNDGRIKVLLARPDALHIETVAWITAGSAGVLTGKLLQLCNGAVYDENKSVQIVHDCKLEAFLEVVEQLNGEHALVFYNFQHDKGRILEALDGKGLHVRVYQNEQDEIDWNDGKIDILLAHPASCAYGLNLQRGGHHVIWFSLTWSLEQYQQANKRLHRQGQECPVIIHHLIVQGGVDEDVIQSLNGKEEVQNSLLNALKVRLDAAKGE